MILEISSALMSIVYSGGPCPPVALRGAPPPHSAFPLGGPCPPVALRGGPHRPTPLFHSGAPAPRSRFVGPHRPTPLFHSPFTRSPRAVLCASALAAWRCRRTPRSRP